jgi:hypothetical protein
MQQQQQGGSHELISSLTASVAASFHHTQAQPQLTTPAAAAGASWNISTATGRRSPSPTTLHQQLARTGSPGLAAAAVLAGQGGVEGQWEGLVGELPRPLPPDWVEYMTGLLSSGFQELAR